MPLVNASQTAQTRALDRFIFIASDLSMPLVDVVRLYGLCLKIELSFEQALRVLSFPEG